MNEELKTTIENTVASALERAERIKAVFAKKIWDVEDLAIALKKSESRIRHMAREQAFPSYVQNGQLFFKREEIEAWQTQCRRPSKNEIASEAATRLATSRIK